MTKPTMASFELLGPLDIGLWYGDSPATPMNMGNVCLFEGTPLFDASGVFRLEDVRRSIESRLHLVPRYRRKILESLGGHLPPVLVDDPGFAIANHVELVSLPRPGTLEQLKQVFARVHEGTLDHSRALWKIVFVEGLEDGRVGMIQKIHHTPFDGATTVRIMELLFDKAPDAPPVEPEPWQPQPPPNPIEILAAALGQHLRSAWKLYTGPHAPWLHLNPCHAREIAETIAAMRKFAPAPRTSLNRRVGTRRRFDWTTTTLGDVKLMRGLVTGSKLNDVMLAAVAGGLRALFQARGEDVNAIRPRVFVPVDARDESDGAQLGNQVSAMVMVLPIDEPDPVSRLRTIATQMEALKAGKQATSVKLMMDLASFTPPVLLAVSRSQIGKMPLFMNLTVTNVPGPRHALYLLGARMLELNPMLPIGNMLTVNVAVESYTDQISVGICCDPEAVPEVDELTRGIRRTLDELLERAGAQVDA